MEGRLVQAFRLLGVPVGSDRELVVEAYRRLARHTHPDVSADPTAADRFAALTDAYRLASQAAPPATIAVARGTATGRPSTPPDRSPSAERPLPRTKPTTPHAGAWSVRGAPIVAGPVVISPIRSASSQERGDG